jgi:uncharacterized protein YyaL (SSP411 family)
LEAAKGLALDPARRFALRSLDRILSEGWRNDRGLRHVIAYSEPGAPRRDVPGLLDDYAFTAVACLDAYEATADLTYFRFARRIVDRMVEGFFDPVAGGFFDTAKPGDQAQKSLGVLGTRRKPFQDSPTPAGNSVAAIALLRMHGWTNHPGYREQAEQTIEVLAGRAEQFGLFAATYGVAAVHLARPHTQVVVVGNDARAEQLQAAAVRDFSFGKAVLRLSSSQAVAPNLPPALGETIPLLPFLEQEKTAAVVCTEFRCQAPIFDAEELSAQLRMGLTKQD